MIKLFNTLTRKKELFKPITNKQVGLYCCGPTVYWFAHLGNLRTYIFEDILRRVLEYNGYQILHIMNYTDVGHLTSNADTGEDKIEKGAKREGKSAWEIAEFYIKAFEKDAAALNILKPDRTPRATDHIQEQIDLIKILEEKGFTYTIDDGVYFDTSRLKDYGALARLDTKNLKAGARIQIVSGKKNPTDFALWKFPPAGTKRQMEWESPWAPPGKKEKVKGFPGWHIECSAMSRKYLGQPFDVHCGGIDHLNIHHTNEIAQSEAAFGQNPALFWLHGEHMFIDGGRMGKSEQNFLTVQALIDKKFSPLAFRYLTLTAHYRSKLNFTWESLSASQRALDNLYQIFSGFSKAGVISSAYKKQFQSAINDDLNMPEALAIVWKLIKDEGVSDADKKATLLNFNKVLGFGLATLKKTQIPARIKKLADDREKLRQQKKWDEADNIRKEIEDAGWQVEDTEKGPKIAKKL